MNPGTDRDLWINVTLLTLEYFGGGLAVTVASVWSMRWALSQVFP